MPAKNYLASPDGSQCVLISDIAVVHIWFWRRIDIFDSDLNINKECISFPPSLFTLNNDLGAILQSHPFRVLIHI